MLRFTTASGTVYEMDGARVRRTGGDTMRRDNEWLTYVNDPVVQVGAPVELWLEPLGEGDVTIRQTTAVITIEEDT